MKADKFIHFRVTAQQHKLYTKLGELKRKPLGAYIKQLLDAGVKRNNIEHLNNE